MQSSTGRTTSIGCCGKMHFSSFNIDVSVCLLFADEEVNPFIDISTAVKQHWLMFNRPNRNWLSTNNTKRQKENLNFHKRYLG